MVGIDLRATSRSANVIIHESGAHACTTHFRFERMRMITQRGIIINQDAHSTFASAVQAATLQKLLVSDEPRSATPL